jgi:6-phosphogluconolactonase
VARDRVAEGGVMMPIHVAMAGSAQTEFVVLRGPKTLARCAAEWLLKRVEAVEGEPAVCLAGGSTPFLLYRLLAEAPWRDRFPWQRVHWFWGDERFVPPDNPRSNDRMVRAALLDRVPVAETHIHPVPTHLPLDEAASAYERTLKDFYGAAEFSLQRPLFAATLLGLGDDGHTASLFPGNAALEEHRHWVAPVPDAQPEPRITLTLPTLASSGEIAFLVSGANKRDVVARVKRREDMPALRIESPGRVHWFIDRAAAGSASGS